VGKVELCMTLPSSLRILPLQNHANLSPARIAKYLENAQPSDAHLQE
jgi:hypothetical protein